MHDARIKAPMPMPVLLNMHPGNPHGLRFIEGDGGGEGDDPDDDEGDEDEDEDEEDEEDDLEGLLDDPDDEDDGGDDDDTPKGRKKKKGGTPLTAEAVADLVERAIDRRMNTPKARRQTGSPQSRGRTWEPSREDLRDARSGYRDAIADRVKFLGPEERQHATAIAERFLSTDLSKDVDPYYAGEQVAGKVAAEIRSLRAFYEKRTVGALRRRGVLPEKKGQPSPGGTQGPSSSGYAAGKARADKLFADRRQQTQPQEGRTP